MENKTWYWYSARENELFIDMDRYKESINHVRRRLQGAIENHFLNVIDVSIVKSVTKNHAHMIITLAECSRIIPQYAPLYNAHRFAWEMLLHGDIYRAASNLSRWAHGIPNPDILISRLPVIGSRQHDKSCNCEGKHNLSAMKICPTAKFFRGNMSAATFFGKPSNNPCKWLPPDVTP